MHWNGIKRVLKYLRRTSDYGLCFKRDQNATLHGYVDSDWAGDLSYWKSTSGFIGMMCGAPVSWFSTKQEVVAKSTSEAEYISLCAGVTEIIWLRSLISGIIPFCRTMDPTIVKIDNQGGLALAKNESVNRRTKHIDVRYHFTREAIVNKKVALEYCPTTEMLADMMTKPLGPTKLDYFTKSSGIGKM